MHSPNTNAKTESATAGTVVELGASKSCRIVSVALTANVAFGTHAVHHTIHGAAIASLLKERRCCDAQYSADIKKLESYLWK